MSLALGCPLAALSSSFPPSALSPPSPTNQQMALHPLRPPHSTWIQSWALNKTEELGPLFSLKDSRPHIGARIKRQLHPKENKTTEYLASQRLFPAHDGLPAFHIWQRAFQERESGGDVKESGRRPHCTTSCDSAIRAAGRCDRNCRGRRDASQPGAMCGLRGLFLGMPFQFSKPGHDLF